MDLFVRPVNVLTVCHPLKFFIFARLLWYSVAMKSRQPFRHVVKQREVRSALTVVGVIVPGGIESTLFTLSVRANVMDTLRT